MTTPLVLTFIGHDRPGLVNAVSETVTFFDASWLESRLAHLAGEFAGIVLIDVADEKVVPLTAALRELEAIGLRVFVEQSSRDDKQEEYRRLKLDLVGHDRPGIVREITQVLTRRGVNIEEFSSRLASASFSGEKLFHVSADLQVPSALPIAEVRTSLERIASEMMVDITLGE